MPSLLKIVVSIESVVLHNYAVNCLYWPTQSSQAASARRKAPSSSSPFSTVVQRARGDTDGVVADAFEAADGETEPRHLAHQLLDVLPGGGLLDLVLDEVPNGGAGGLFLHGVDGEAGLDVLVGVGRHRVVHRLKHGGAEGDRRQSGRIGFQ